MGMLVRFFILVQSGSNKLVFLRNSISPIAPLNRWCCAVDSDMFFGAEKGCGQLALRSQRSQPR